jgi:hypothetical protein
MPPPIFVITKHKIKDKIKTTIVPLDPYDYYPFDPEWKLVYNPKWHIYLNGIRVR